MAGVASGIAVQNPLIPYSALLIAANILPYWPSDTSLRSWIKTSMNSIPSNYQFSFNDFITAGN